MVYGSIYGAARTSSVSEGTFNPDYATPSAAMDMVTEGLETDQKFFELFVEHDFLEAAAYDDVALESTLMAVDESFLGDVWGKIVEFIKKIKDKITSICKAAAVKIGAFFTKDNAALVSKYDKQFQSASLSNITIKGFRNMKNGVTPLGIVNGFNPDADFETVLSGKDVKELEKFKKNYTAQEQIRKVISRRSDVSSNGKIDYMDAVFESARDVKPDASFVSKIKEALTNHQDAITDINKAEKDLKDKLSQMEKDAEKMKTDASDMKIKDNNDDDIKAKELATKKAEVAKAICTVTNTCIGKLVSAGLSAIKFNIKQCRAAYIKIASSGAKNESTLMEATLEADAYEVDSFFEQYSYDYEELTA